MKKSIVLVGMMGSGKSFIGKKLAKKLDMDFLDGDDEIEKKLGMPTGDIFDIQGEEYFRAVEYETTKNILSGKAVVLAVGGGAFIQKITREEIKKNGISIWLKASAETILERLKYDKTRPLLVGGNKKQKIEKLLEKRNPIYSLADIHINTYNKKIQPTIDEMVEKLKKHM